MELIYIVNLGCYIGILLLFSFVLISAARKYKTRQNRVTKWLFFVMLFYGLSLSFVMINTLLEYALDIYPKPWYWGFSDPNAWYFYFQYIFQYQCASDSMIFLGNMFLALFYFEIFVHERKALPRILLVIYIVVTIIFVGLFLIAVYVIELLQIGYSITVPDIIALIPQSALKLIVLLIHTAVIFIPLVLSSTILRRRLVKQNKEENQEMIRKFTYIFMMTLSLVLLFISSFLDYIWTDYFKVSFSIWYYCTFISEFLAAIMAYLGFIKELKKR